ncbi:MAG TPA: twin-arginine translocase TatA/TatE family subunit [Gemmatimonadaceae bacterium]|jgi:sec-independent protein translocase protein TatA|nr:twin-arginine translocase TatA/TatE family subunit [Gemmatimonadaceae bacterium]
MPHFSFPELIIIFMVVLLIFGAKRVPEIFGSMGKGIKEFKKQMNEVEQMGSGNSYSSPRLTGEDLQRTPSTTAPEADRPEPKRLLS